jgi:argininosuccinate synthase
MSQEKVILAYSGGLDTSVILKWLLNQGYDVVAYLGNVGIDEDFTDIKEKALQTGASRVYIEDLRKEFITDFIFPALQGNAIYEGRYLLGTAIARPLIAKKQIEIAHKENAQYVSHGATGKGNDQVRFEFAYNALDPNIKIISPWKDEEFLNQFKGRTDLLEYADKYDIPVKASREKSYSEDDNLMHISHEAGILEDPSKEPPEHVYTRTSSIKDAPNQEDIIEIEFEDGVPVKVVNEDENIEKKDPLDFYNYLNDLGAKHGIGRIDMVENRFIGIKSRGIYETPAATILWAAHRDLEGVAMDKEVMHIRDSLIPKFAELIYNGLWFSPEMDFLMNAMNKSQERITGKVKVALIKGNVNILGRSSPTSLYDRDLSSMDIEGGFDAEDSRGFININAIRLKAHHAVLREKDPYLWRYKKQHEDLE